MAFFISFSPELVALQKELSSGFHKELTERLAKIADLDERIAAVAYYCDVLVDGNFTPKEVLALYAKLTERLVEKRTRGDTPIILLS